MRGGGRVLLFVLLIGLGETERAKNRLLQKQYQQYREYEGNQQHGCTPSTFSTRFRRELLNECCGNLIPRFPVGWIATGAWFDKIAEPQPAATVTSTTTRAIQRSAFRARRVCVRVLLSTTRGTPTASGAAGCFVWIVNRITAPTLTTRHDSSSSSIDEPSGTADASSICPRGDCIGLRVMPV